MRFEGYEASIFRKENGEGKTTVIGLHALSLIGAKHEATRYVRRFKLDKAKDCDVLLFECYSGKKFLKASRTFPAAHQWHIV